MHRRRFLARLIATGLALSLGACAHRPPRQTAPADPLPGLILERLLIAREVAVAKHYSGAPVHDPARETEILVEIVAQGRARGLEPAVVEAFFTAQLAASRSVQEELLDLWRSGLRRPDHPPLDLRRELRPKLDALTPRLLDALSVARSPEAADELERALASAGFSPPVIALASAPLR